MATPPSKALSSSDDLLPNYYASLNVLYNASSDAIEDAFLRLANEPDAFQNYKRMICDAFMCLASSGDRAAYDAFYFHTPCWYSKPLWLAYRNERRRLTWNETAKTNSAFLSELQQAVHAALLEAEKAGDAAAAGNQGPVNIAMGGAKLEATSSGAAAKQPPVPSPAKRALRRRRAKQYKRAKEEEEKNKQQEDKGLVVKVDYGLRDGSESGQSDNTLVGGGQQANPAESTASAVIDHIGNGAANGIAKPAAEVAAKAKAVIYGEPLPDKMVLSSQPAAAAAEKPQPTPLSTLASKETNKIFIGSGAGSGTGAGPGRASAIKLPAPAASPSRPAGLVASVHANLTNKNGLAPAPAPAPADKPASTTANRKVDKANNTRTASPAAKPVASTATAMTAAVASKARAAHRPAATVGKQPASGKTPCMPAAPAAHNRKAANAATTAPLTRGRLSTPSRLTATAQRNTATSAPKKQLETAAGPSAATVKTAAEAAATAATQPDKESASAVPLKQGYLANSRWADPLTCANGRPRHPQTLDNWQRLSRPGKCASCGTANFQQSSSTATVKTDGPSKSLSSHLYWCRMCDAAFCNVCHIGNIVRARQREDN